MRLDLAVGERLVEHEVRERETSQGRVVVIACVDADGAVRDVDAVAAQAAEEGKKGGRRVAEDAGLTAVMPVKIFVARPEQMASFGLARVLAVVQSGVNVKRVLVFVIE